MARIEWDTTGSRKYEVGVDRGVLYTTPTDGVPWNGLVSVGEEPIGGNIRPLYYDGVRYANISELSETSFTLEAYSAPQEFSACEGETALTKGLFVGNQYKTPFSFSYRTGVGNDVENLEYGYKLHLVYNAMVSARSTSHKTTGRSISPETLSWKIEAVPEAIAGINPTAHYIFDSTQMSPVTLAMLESTLYGIVSKKPRLPSISEIVSWINTMESQAAGKKWNTISSRINLLGSSIKKTSYINNYALNPNGQNAGINNVLFRENLIPNPLGQNSPLTTVGWRISGAASNTMEILKESIKGEDTQFLRYTKKTDTGSFYIDPSSNFKANVGDTIRFSIDIRTNDARVAEGMGITTSLYNGYVTTKSNRVSIPNMPINTWVRATIENTVIETTENGYIRTLVWPPHGDYQIGAAIDIKNAIVEIGSNLPPDHGFFDGNTTPIYDFIPSWSGTMGNSSSLLSYNKAADINGSAAIPFVSRSQNRIGFMNLGKSGTSAGYVSEVPVPNYPLNTPLTLYVDAITFSQNANSKGFSSYTVGDSIGNSKDFRYFSKGGQLQVRHFGSATSTSIVPVNYRTNGAEPGDVIYFRLMMVDGTYEGPYFDGSSSPFVYRGQRVTPEWSTIKGRQSRFQMVDGLSEMAKQGDAYILSDELYVFNDGAWTNFGSSPAL